MGSRALPHRSERIPTVATAFIADALPYGLQEIPPDPSFEKDPELGVIWGNHPLMPEAIMQAIKEDVRARKACFAYSNADLPGYSGDHPPFSIELTTETPVFERPRQYSKGDYEVLDLKCNDLKATNMIEECKATVYASCPTMPMKKDAEGNKVDRRFCLDYRALNAVTKPDRYGLHLPEQLFQQLGDSKYFTKWDARAGFYQCVLSPASKPLTAFWWRNSTWQFTRMPFGLRNASSHFQRVMDYEINKRNMGGFLMAFIDDLLCHSSSPELHRAHIAATCDFLIACDLRAHPDKTVIAASVVEYLGHNVSSHGISSHEAKVAAIRALRVPGNVAALRSFLGFCGYYRCYVPGYSTIADPLNRLLRGGVAYVWQAEQQQAFDNLIAALTVEGRALRRVVPDQPLILHTDWSAVGIGAILGQMDAQGREYMCACISRSLNKHERNYSSYQGEMLAVVWAVRTFRVHLHGTAFTIVTDHQPLAWLMSNRNLTGHYARWALSLQDYDFTIVHRAGMRHQNVDLLSRNPRPDTFDGTGARLDQETVEPAEPGVAAVIANAARVVVPSGHAALPLPLGGMGAADVQHRDDLLTGDLADLASKALPPPPQEHGGPALERRRLLHSLADWQVNNAKPLPRPGVQAPPPRVRRGLPTVNRAIVSSTFWPQAWAEGITVLELFGGMCAGIEMLLRNNVRVARYLYCDISPQAHMLARHRLRALQAVYPDLLQHKACAASFTTLPQDVWELDAAVLLAAGSQDGCQWLVVGGWDCRDLSTAGRNAGPTGSRSGTFFPCVQVVQLLQAQQQLPPGFLLENVATQHNWVSDVVRIQATELHDSVLGAPITVDAARLGARAHRVRNFWTNLAPIEVLQHVLDTVQRPTDATVNDILTPGRSAQDVRVRDRPPFYPCNIPGQPMAALPTLVSYPASHAYRDGKPGMVRDPHGKFSVPTAIERERAMGYADNATAAPGLTEYQRQALLGGAMDATTMEQLFAICAALHRSAPLPITIAQVLSLQLVGVKGSHGPRVQDQQQADAPSSALQVYNDNFLEAMVDEAKDNQRSTPSTRDIWEDSAVLAYLKEGTIAPDTPEVERKRIARRANLYQWEAGKLIRRMASGTHKRVPAPDARAQLIISMHELCGHFGIKRTSHLVMHQHWWRGLVNQVRQVVTACAVCARVNAGFNCSDPQLHPLPIMGMFYRWGVDLFGPLPVSRHGNKYGMVMIEHFSKWVEVTAIPSKSAHVTAHAFNSAVLSRYGAPAEVVTDGGTEFQGEFAQLLERTFVDHRTTSPNHPQADGLAERCVLTVKQSLRKYCSEGSKHKLWEDHLAMILLGYRCSKQASSGFTPYELVFAREPTIPPAIRERLADAVDFNDTQAAVEALEKRAAALKHCCAIGGDNLLIAQKRMELRYGIVKGGGYSPKLLRFEPGDFVYVRFTNSNTALKPTLMPLARSVILRVHEARPSGTLMLQGRCGGLTPVHVTNCAPCHLPGIDAEVDPTLARPPTTFACVICNFFNDQAVLLLCDGCGSAYHIYCLVPPLDKVPTGVWLCPVCIHQGLTKHKVQQRAAALQAAPSGEDHPEQPQGDEDGAVLLPAATPGEPMVKYNLTVAARDARAEALDGRVVLDTYTKKGQKVHRYGTLHFVGAESRPRYFEVRFADGSSLPERVTYTWASKGRLQGLGTAVPTVEQAGMPVESVATVSLLQSPVLRSEPRRADIKLLFQVLNLSELKGIVDMWGHDDGAIAQAARELLPKAVVWSNSEDHSGLALSALDPLQMGSYHDLRACGVVIDAVISSPPSDAVGAGMAAAHVHAGWVTCVLLPLTVANNALLHDEWLSGKDQAGLVLRITDAAPQPGSASMWVCVFRHNYAKCLLVRSEYVRDGEVSQEVVLALARGP